MKKVFFKNIIKTEKKIEMDIKTVGDDFEIEEKLFFEFSNKIDVNDNQIAVALSTLCGRVYDEIYMDLIINERLFENIKNFTLADLKVKRCNDIPISNKKSGIMLAFSGGYDSLSTFCLLDNPSTNLKLVSLDLQGKFSREEDFFKYFAPYTVKSNFATLRLNSNHWTFMYIPIIFYGDMLDCQYATLGGILESSVYSFSERYNLREKDDGVPLSFLNIDRISFIQGLTEIGTAMVISHYKPELIDLSLKSLANPGEEKRYRKQLITQIIQNKFDKKIYMEPIHSGNTLKWGDSLLSDFLSLYFIKYAGLEEALKLVEEIPSEAISFSESISLNFYEKYNTNFLNNIPKEYISDFLKKLALAGIYPYNSKDWDEYYQVIDFLSNYHSNLRDLINNK